MGSTYKCTLCDKDRPGRFTRRKIAAGGGWSQNLDIPNWYCYRCLPEGEGRGEETPMPAKQTAVAPRVDPQAMKQEALTIIQPYADAVDTLTIESEDEYHAADLLKAKIRSARKMWTARIEKIIRPIRQGLDELYELSRDGDRPLGVLEDKVTDAMKVYKVKELQAARAVERERERLQAEADAKLKAAETAKTPQMRGRLQTAAARVQQQAQTIQAPAPVFAEHSSVRPVKKVRIISHGAFLKGIVDGYVPADCIDVLQGKLNAYLKDDPEGMAAWPGVEVYDDVQIVGR